MVAAVADGRQNGFTLVELMIVIAIIGTLASLAIPGYLGSLEKTRVTRAITDLKGIERVAYLFMVDNGRFPNTLIEAGLGVPMDPWGHPYVYYPIDNVPAGIKIRKDKSLHPVNTDFDLYSIGRDGRSVAPFTAGPSQDDVVRANNGGYIGLVKYY